MSTRSPETRVAIVGPDAAAHGGVAAFVQALLASPLAERCTLVPVATHRDGSPGEKLIQGVRGLGRLLVLCAAGRVDVVHVHASWKASFARKSLAVAIARATRRRVVLHLHGTSFAHALARRGLRGAAQRWAFRTVVRAADAVVAATPQWAGAVERCAGIANVVVVPNTANVVVPPVRPQRRPPAAVLYLGRLHRDKGVFELLDAVAALRRDGRDVSLVLCGSGPAENELRQRAREHGLDETQVAFPGWVDSDAKQRLLAAAWCLALPSYWPEGVPLAVLEAMLSGVPVVATRVGGIPEVARDGEEIVFVAPRDAGALEAALAALVDDPELAQRIAAAAQRRAFAEFSPAVVAERLAGVYERALNGEAPRAEGAESTTRSSQRSTS